jgi:hypothetical protein
MSARHLRVLLILTALIVAGIGVFAPLEWPARAIQACLLASAPLAFLVLADRSLSTWLARHRGDAVGPGDFVREEWPGLVSRLGGLLVFAGVVATIKLWVRADGFIFPLGLAAIGAGGVLIGGMGALIRRPPKRRSAIQDLFELTRRRTYQEEVVEAAAFSRAVAGRLALPEIKLMAGSFFMMIIVLAIGASLFMIGERWMASGMSEARGEFHPLSQLGIAIGLGSAGYIHAAMMLALFRIVSIARQSGRPPASGVFRQLGHSFETLGFLNTVPWSLAVAGLIVLLGFSSWIALDMALGREFASAPLGIGIACVTTSILAWLLIFLPQVFVFAIFCHRDCGWVGAIETSTTLLTLEGFTGLRRALRITFWTATIVRLPAAIHLTLSILDDRGPLLAGLLREKPMAEAVAQVKDVHANHPSALRKPFELLESGHYLEALNAFQIYLRRNREDLPARRGECLAMLYLGNFRGAREKIEVWASLEPANDEPHALLQEIKSGLWNEDGAKFKEACARIPKDAKRLRAVEAPLRPM